MLSKVTIQIDDFYTSPDVISGLHQLIELVDVSISVFALPSSSEKEELSRQRISSRIQYIGIHGWNHFVEGSFGYWEMRHLLETALSRHCFDRMITMPWNRMPKLGAIKALAEKRFCLVTPYGWQRIIATVLGCNSIDLHSILLHPSDLLDNSTVIETAIRLNKVMNK